MTHPNGQADRNDSAPNEYLGYYGKVPLGLSQFPRDVVLLPESWGRGLGDVRYYKRHTEGGHFAAWERPDLLADDLRRMFAKCRGIKV